MRDNTLIYYQGQKCLLVSPIFLYRHSGAEEQCQLFYHYLKQKGIDVRVATLSKKVAKKYQKSNKNLKLLIITLFSFKVLYLGLRHKRDVVIAWGLPAALSSFSLRIAKKCFFSFTERQWSQITSKRKSIYKLVSVDHCFFNSAYVLSNFQNMLVRQIPMSVFYNIKNRDFNILKNDEYQSPNKAAVIARINKSKEIENAFFMLDIIGLDELHIYGRIEDESYKNWLTQEAGLRKKSLVFHGKIAKTTMFSGFKYLINTSVNEGMPNSVLEAIYRKKIVLSIPAEYLDEINYPSKYMLRKASSLENMQPEDFEPCRRKIIENFSV